MNLLRIIANIENKNSITNKIRRENFEVLKTLISSYNRKVKILDLGGTQEYWEMMNFTDPNLIDVILVNFGDIKVTLPNFKFVKSDVFDLNLLAIDCDIIFSHSLIEHVDHEKFSKMIRYFNKSYFIQTPNKYFPIEPHFMIPLLQFMPTWLKYWIVRIFCKNNPEEVKTIKLLSESEVKRLFPKANIYGARILGMRQSFIVCKKR